MAKRAFILVGHPRGNGLRYIQAAQGLVYPIALSADPAQYDYLTTEGIDAINVDINDLDSLIRECSRLCATFDIAGITGESVYAAVCKLCQHFDID